MTHPSKRKGNQFERELVQLAQQHGHYAKRAYASNGKALGYCEQVDVVINGHRIQCKRRRSLPNWLAIPDGVDMVAVREDRGDVYLVVKFGDVFKDQINGS